MFTKAIRDLKGGIEKRRFWINFALLDIRQKYRGSILGPLWITISMAIFIFAVSLVYARLFKQDLGVLVPYLCGGFLFWNYITTVINESCDLFIREKEFIENINLPYFCYIFKLFARNIIVFLHNVVVLLFVLFLFKVPIGLMTLLFIPGFILLNSALISMSLIIGFLGVRYRDIPPIINSLLTVMFFVSPITWKTDMLPPNSLIVKLNPVTYALDIVRAPLLGSLPNLDSYIVMSVMTLILGFVAMSIFGRYKSRIAYWIV